MPPPRLGKFLKEETRRRVYNSETSGNEPMSEVRDLLEIWNTANTRGEEIVLATVVRTEGSSYRKPGARMILTRGGRRSGMISGGCLEGEITRKAWWLTESGPNVQVYGTYYDEDEPTPRGLGCGGKVHLLLERGESATLALEAMWESAISRTPFAVSTVTKSAHPAITVGSKLVMRDGSANHLRTDIQLSNHHVGIRHLTSLTGLTLEQRRSSYVPIEIEAHPVEIFAEYICPSPALYVFGAGDDAIPIVEFAYRMGWHTTVADARSHLATRARFPKADKIVTLNVKPDSHARPNSVAETVDLSPLSLGPEDSGILMTHSYMHDRALLAQLLPLNLNYLGLLGPRLRTSKLLKEVGPRLGLTERECQARLHSPAGLNLGADGPVGIALSIVAEIQSAVHACSVSRSHLHDQGLSSSRRVLSAPPATAQKISA